MVIFLYSYLLSKLWRKFNWKDLGAKDVLMNGHQEIHLCCQRYALFAKARIGIRQRRQRHTNANIQGKVRYCPLINMNHQATSGKLRFWNMHQ